MSVPLVIVELIANRNAPRLLAHHCFVQHRWRSKEDVVLFVQIPFNKVRTTIANFCLSFLFVFCVFIFAIRIQVCNDNSGLFNIQYVMCSLGGPYSEKLPLRSWKCCTRPSSLFMPVGNILPPFCPVLGYCSGPKVFLPVKSSRLDFPNEAFNSRFHQCLK